MTEVRRGALLGQYQVLELIGSGGMGEVYRAKDIELQRPVALKVLRPTHAAHADLIAQLETEAKLTAGVVHPNVVRVYTTGTTAGRFYIAMELMEGGTLQDVLKSRGRLDEPDGVQIAISVADGLRAAHRAGLIHRDIKPGNLLFGSGRQIKVVDFGLATFMEGCEPLEDVWGTPFYLPPERLRQEAEDLRSDIYALGATLFHVFSGRPPFEAPTAQEVAMKHLNSRAPSVQAFAPHLSNQTAFIINRMLSKDPSARHQSYDELIEHLTFVQQDLETRRRALQPVMPRVVAVEAPPAPVQKAPQPLSWLKLSVLIAVLTILVAVLVVTFAKREEPLTAAQIAAARRAAELQSPDEPVAQPKPVMIVDEAPAKDGAIYELVAACAPDRRLDVSGAWKGDDGSVHIWDAIGINGQHWQLFEREKGWWELIPLCAPTCCLEATGSHDGARVRTAIRKGEANQQWRFSRADDGTWGLQARSAPGMRLDVRGSADSNGAVVQLFKDLGASGQVWRLVPVDVPPPSLLSTALQYVASGRWRNVEALNDGEWNQHRNPNCEDPEGSFEWGWPYVIDLKAVEFCEDNDGKGQVAEWKLQTWDDKTSEWKDIFDWRPSDTDQLQRVELNIRTQYLKLLLRTPGGNVTFEEFNVIGR